MVKISPSAADSSRSVFRSMTLVPRRGTLMPCSLIIPMTFPPSVTLRRSIMSGLFSLMTSVSRLSSSRSGSYFTIPTHIRQL